MATISTLNVQLTANITRFAAGMGAAAKSLTAIRSAYAKASDAAAAYERMNKGVGELKLAGADTLTALQTTLAVARSELRRFSRNTDVQVAIEIAREHLDEAWLKARPFLQRAIDASGIKVAAAVVSDKTRDARAWLDRQRRALARPVALRVEVARRAIDNQIAAVRSRLEGLKRYRAVRIGIAAVNATRLPAQAALATLGPLRRLAASGIKIGLHASHAGIAVAVNRASALLGGLARRAGSVAASVGRSFASIAGSAARLASIGAGAAFTGVTGLGIYAVKLAADAEQARVAFTTMLGDAEKAKQLQAEINDFAAATPFQTPELIGSAKSLLAFGVAQEQIIPTMRTLGDLSAGLNIPLGELSELYGKARVQGRLFAQDINQLTGRGIPVIQEFAKQFNVGEGEVRKLVEAGKIGFPELQKALISLTSDGGKFAGLMAAQSQTVAGQWSTLEDTVTLNLTKIGEVITEKLNLRGVIAGVSESLDVLASTGMPLLESFLGRLAEGGDLGARAGGLVLSGMEVAAKGIAYALNFVDLLAAGWRAAQAGVAYAIGGLLKGIDWLGSGIVKLLNLMPGVNLQWTDTIGLMSDALIDEGNKLASKAGENWDSFAGGDRIRAVEGFFQQVRTNAEQARTATDSVGQAATQTAMKVEQATNSMSEKAAASIADLQKEVARFGLAEGQIKLAELRENGATADQIAQAEKLLGLKAELESLSKIDTGDVLTDFAAKMEKLQQLYAAGKVTAEQFAAIREAAKSTVNDKLADEARNITDSVKTPLEKYQEEISRLNELLARGLISQETFDRAAFKARQTLDGGQLGVKAISARSAEAQAIAYDSTRGMQRLTRDDYAKQQLAKTDTGNRFLEQIATNTKNRLTVVEIV